MNDASLVCWKCGHSLAALTLPLLRLDECKNCGAQLHVCRLCEFYDVRVAKHCRETIAEEVKDKERANFCDYFKPRPQAYASQQLAAAAQAKAQLDALFGANSTAMTESPDSARRQLDELFKK